MVISEGALIVMDTRLFRKAMGKFATGITVVLTNDQNDINGITVNAFMSLSLDPMLIAISLDQNASIYPSLQHTNRFGISILEETQKDISMIFAKQKEMSQEDVVVLEMAGAPVIHGAVAQLACEKESEVRAGDHIIFIAKVVGIDVNDKEPLVYFNGEYQTINK